MSNTNTEPDLELEAIKKKSLALVTNSNIVMVGSNADDGFPNIKAVFKADAEGMNTIWISSNTSSKRVAQFKKDSRACLYFVNDKTFEGLRLTGEMEVLSDHESKERLWSDGCEIYYPLGVDDPDYSVLRFTAKCANYYNDLKTYDFLL
jgi:general stress protein 26